MPKERQGYQLSFLKPPPLNMEGFVDFALPGAKTFTLTSKGVLGLDHAIAHKNPAEKTLRERNYWYELGATPGQVRDIERRSRRLGIPEPLVRNAMEARNMQYALTGALNRRNAERKLRKLKKSK